MQDNALLTQYAHSSSEAAFSQLLARHLPLVYRTCRRELASEALAEDAAQVVFLLLARKAKTLRADPSLAGWLYQTAVFVAKDIRKQEARRRRREEAVMQESIHAQTAPATEWDTVEPLLNAGLSSLKPADRDAVLLRFLEGHTLAETGARLGISEDAARMRCARALEKLRCYLTSHGAAVTGLVLTGFLTAEAADPVPAHATEVVTQGTLQAISANPTANVLLLSKGVSHTMKIIKVKYAALAAGLLLVGAAVPPLVHALSPHRPSVMRQVQISPNPTALQDKKTTKFTLAKNQHAYYSFTLPAGESLIVLDIRQSDNQLSTGALEKTRTFITYRDQNGEQVARDNGSYGNNMYSFFDETVASSSTENRLVDRKNLKSAVPLVLDVQNQDEKCNYWLTVLTNIAPVSDSSSKSDPLPVLSSAFAVPLFGEVVPKPAPLGGTVTGKLAENGHAYFALPLKAGSYRATLAFSNMSGDVPHQTGGLIIHDEIGVVAGGSTSPIGDQWPNVPDHDGPRFTLYRNGIYLLEVSGKSGISQENAASFTVKVTPSDD